MHDYKKQATDLLEKFGIEFEYENLGSEGTEVSRVGPKRKNYRYIARFIRPGKQVEFDFHDSISNYEKNIKRIYAYDVLACLTKDNPGMFSAFCWEYGYDEDSRKAFAEYEAVCEEWKKVSSFFSASEIEELREVQ